MRMEEVLAAKAEAYQQRSDTPDSEMIQELIAVVCKLGGAAELAEYLDRDHSQEG